jgi:hypothetical protein
LTFDQIKELIEILFPKLLLLIVVYNVTAPTQEIVRGVTDAFRRDSCSPPSPSSRPRPR